MSGVLIPAALRLANWQRANGRCEYCLLHEEDSLVPHQPDHIIAAQHGGLPTAENLALACYDCNLFKGPNIASVDPATGEPAFLVTVFLLQFNLPSRVRLRAQLQRAKRFPS